MARRTARAALRYPLPRLLLLLSAVLLLAGAGQQKSVVRALLFFSPSCPHCHDVIDNHLPPLLAKHGDALRIVAVNVQTPDGQALYQRVALHFALPNERLGVPALVVGDRVLVGSGEIPAEFPRIVEAGIAAGGIAWPAIDAVAGFLRANGMLGEAAMETPPVEASVEPAGRGVDAAAAAASPAAGAGGEEPRVEPAPQAGAEAMPTAEEPVESLSGLVVVESGVPSGTMTRVWQKFSRDPVGNGLSVLILLGMVVVAALAVRAVALGRGSHGGVPRWSVPVLAIIGAGIAGYMSFVEVTHAEAVCGPVGDCNAVQSSPYANLLGVPIGLLGLVGYAAIGGGWVWLSRARGGARRQAGLLLWSAALAGVLFSVYLTFLEPFVIGATCVWCLNSAVIMTLILVALTPGAVAASRRRGAAVD